mmetsp:Transcript_44854/g.101263  ORF Transcript_44854/g.101263 Transcript_44854/m.101263 type:complete len:225 (-) Transcript_44854:13-687(-)
MASKATLAIALSASSSCCRNSPSTVRRASDASALVRCTTIACRRASRILRASTSHRLALSRASDPARSRWCASAFPCCPRRCAASILACSASALALASSSASKSSSQACRSFSAAASNSSARTSSSFSAFSARSRRYRYACCFSDVSWRLTYRFTSLSWPCSGSSKIELVSLKGFRSQPTETVSTTAMALSCVQDKILEFTAYSETSSKSLLKHPNRPQHIGWA